MTANGADVTRVTEDYLALIWKACEWPDDGRRPNTTDLAAALGVTPSTVSASLKRLAREGMIKYRPYGNIELTEAGERIGRAVVRRHRIIETYLVTSLGMPWDQVHDEADRLEHAASEALVDRMDEILGHPAADPHGDPIPRSRDIDHPGAMLIAHVNAGTEVRVVRVSDSNPEILRFLTERGIAIGTRLEVLSGLSGMGLMAVEHAGTEIELSAPIAEAIHVAPAT
ncbi:metal-dependent transcriptional regulator [[Pseudopropionibacterium] massiliense]|uniref:metal-dependent transcriptional regulator n=1 Tax=[Pseudopropionibacterium] massiliense TaxID=2220000 RepID=UPI001FE48780|nr:metal-dependent transcriptional regulator [[Pseudopropionibacterium] massiliense]